MLTVVLARDPVAGTPVERTAVNLLHGLLSLVPRGDALFADLQQSGAIERAFAWVSKELTRFNLTWEAISRAFRAAVDAVSGWHPIDSIHRILDVFRPLIARLGTFAVDVGRKVLEFIFEGALTVAGPLGQRVLGIVGRAGEVITTIMHDPIGFGANLVHAVVQGFHHFSSHIMQHLQTGLMGWLFGTLGQAGPQLPERFDLRGIVSLVLQVVGLTYNRLRGILVRLIGERPVAVLERSFGFLRTLVTQGLAAAWQQIVAYAEGLVDSVVGAIRDWVAQSVVGAAITRLVSMFNPAGAVIQAIIAIYNVVQFFIERAQQIAAVAEAVFDSIGRIAGGDVAGAADFVEQTLARAIPVVLGFLARLLGLGNMVDHIRYVIQRVQGVVDGALNRVAGWIARRAMGLFARRSGMQKPGTTTGDADPRSLSDKQRDLDSGVTQAESHFARPREDPCSGPCNSARYPRPVWTGAPRTGYSECYRCSGSRLYRGRSESTSTWWRCVQAQAQARTATATRGPREREWTW
ncbi:MAG: hypothetical protein JO023_27635 [Chloroflexi bacterium]|nr:hypothetical protein [Chloroflexota bacterium]